MEIVDTAGPGYLPNIQPDEYYILSGESQGLVIVYSITMRESLSDLIDRVESLSRVTGTEIQDMPLVLVGTRDDQEERQVSREEGERNSA